MKHRNTLVSLSLALAAFLSGSSGVLSQTVGPVPAGINYDIPNSANSPLPQLSGSLSGIRLTDSGCGYTLAVSTDTIVVTIDPPPSDAMGALLGTQATASASVNADGSLAIQLTEPGTGYVSVPAISISLPAGAKCRCSAVAVALMDVVPGTGLRKFLDSLPVLTKSGANNLGNYIPVAVPEKWADGSDYYEIALVDYRQQMHSDLGGATKLRGYVQIYSPEKGTPTDPNALPLLDLDGTTQKTITIGGTSYPIWAHDKPRYMGPMIQATKNVPTRIKFYNLLGAGPAGNLFLPVDTTIMGAGAAGWALGADGKQHYFDETGKVDGTGKPGLYPQNRANLHLHGGFTPWIADGTPHQWTVPVGDLTTPYQKGVSTREMPDMPAGQGVMTLYFPNQQSGRLMWYHDHSWGITRLNVYAGEAAGYLLSDTEEETVLKAAGVPDLQIPLVIQDKTFVWGEKTAHTGTWANDPLWADVVPNSTAGDLWFPHVYMANQNPGDAWTGANPLGRWDYGPWFWPPQQPGSLDPLPKLSTVPEAFMDTMIVNGTPYPYLNVPAEKVRLRILNASNDRMLNLQLYQADTTGYSVDGHGTEVAMVPATPNPAIPFPALWKTQVSGMIPEILDNRPGGVPDPRLRGPAFVQIGTEGGLLPAPAVINNTPVGYEQNKRNIVVLSVSQKSLFMGPAERADVVVDFSAYAGKTVILYNDSPAPVPAGDPRLSYYTGNEDFSITGGDNYQGGAPSTLPGYGPNVRTIMQFRVAGTADPANPPQGDEVDQSMVDSLNTKLAALFKTRSAQGEPIIIPEPTYPADSGAYSVTPTFSRIQDTSLTFPSLNPDGTPVIDADGNPVTITKPMLPKCIQELFESHGRMNATLGVEIPLTSFLIQTTIPYGYIDPETESIASGETQIWKITHNGVDTHALHFHLVNVQVINRVGWDGAVRPPDANELGWKETVRMSPLEDCIVAVRAKPPLLPWKLESSVRPLDPSAPLNTTTQFTGVDVNNNPVTVTNLMTDFGWEYVWHCHLLGHEENDMMRPFSMLVDPSDISYIVDKTLPTVSATVVPTPNAQAISYTDATVKISALDAGSGVASITYWATGAQPIGTAAQPVTIPGNTVSVLINVNGSTLVSFTAKDNQGNVSTVGTQSVQRTLDNTAPTATFAGVSTATPVILNGTSWYNANVTGFTATATDDLSGLATFSFSTVVANRNGTAPGSATAADLATNPLNWTSATVNFPNPAGGLSNDGTYTATMTYTATDAAGNARTASQVTTLGIDKTVPNVASTATPNITSGGSTSAANGVAVTITGTDARSGVASITYTQTYTNTAGVVTVTTQTVAGASTTLNLTSEGGYGLSFTSKDNAGNVSAAGTRYLKIDRTAPTIPTLTTLNGTASSIARGPGNVPITIAGTVTGNLVNGFSSGFTTVSYSITATGFTTANGNITPTASTGAFTTNVNVTKNITGTAARIYTITVTATDAAGNTVSRQSTFTVN